MTSGWRFAAHASYSDGWKRKYKRLRPTRCSYPASRVRSDGVGAPAWRHAGKNKARVSADLFIDLAALAEDHRQQREQPREADRKIEAEAELERALFHACSP